MTREDVTRWAQRSIALGTGFLVLWHVAALANAPRRTLTVLAFQGFVLHVAFGKAYSLVPSYFDRQFELSPVPFAQTVLTAGGTVLLSAGLWAEWTASARIGVGLWAGGVAAFVGGLLWTIQGNLTGRATATGDANADRRDVDRVANVFLPVVLAYLLAGTYGFVALYTGLPTVGGYPPAVTHLLAAGFGALLLFAIGFRLLPRFMVAHPPRGAARIVLPAGALGPALLALGLPAGDLLRAGAVIESVAVVGFTATVVSLYRQSDRDRVGFYGVLAGVAAGTGAVVLGSWMTIRGISVGLARAHLRLNLLGLLGLSIVGAAYQFYPPAVGSHRLASDGTALLSIAALTVGLALQTVGLLAGVPLITTGGEAAGTVGAVVFALLTVSVLRERGQL